MHSAIAHKHYPRPPKGAKRPNKSTLARRCAAPLHPLHAAALAAPLPPAADNSRHPDTDQGQTSSCTAHSLVKGIEICTGGRIKGSMHVLYSLTGVYEGENPLADDGRQCTDCLAVAATQGVAPFEGPTSDGRNSDIDASNVTTAATGAELAAAGANLVNFGGNSIDPADPNVSDLVASCIAAGGVVYLGTEVGQAFEQLAGATVAQPDPDPNDPNGGGHALIITGYRTMADGSRQFRVQNSWGETWDDDGECWASLAWVQACWELHPLLPVAAP